MKRIGIWLLIVALILCAVRIGLHKEVSRETFTDQCFRGFVYRAPWNGRNQLTLVSESFHGVLYTQGYSSSFVRQLSKGCYVEFQEIHFTLPKRNRNPGVFNYRTYLMSRNVSYLAQAKSNQIKILNFVPVRYWFHIPGAQFRSVSAGRLENALGLELGALVQGVMTGDAGGMTDEDSLAFRVSGLSHLMAVSGTHVSFVLAPFKRITKKRYCPYRLRSFLLLFPLLFFWVLTDGTPSVTRACFSCAGLLIARVLERPFDGCNFLMLSAGIQILLNPYVLYNSGFLLSYGAAAGIYFILPLLQHKIKFFARKEDAVRSVRLFNRQALAAGIAVNLVLCPLMLYLFGTYSLSGLFLTLYAAFPAGLLCGGGYLLCFLLMVPGGHMLAFVIEGFLTTVGKLLQGLAYIGAILPEPFGYFRIPGIPLWPIVLYFIFLVFVLIFRRRLRVWILLFTITFICTFSVVRKMKPSLSILFADVGQGACVLIQADGYCGLIDTGDGKTNLEDILWAQGVSKLDFVILTHGHQDHTGGLENVLKEFHPRVLYTSGNLESGLQDAQTLAASQGVKVCIVRSFEQIQLGAVTMEFLVSDSFFCIDNESGENNASLNVRLSTQYGSALVCGDLEESGIDALLQMQAFRQTDLLFVPHHGSNSGTSEKMLSNILPKYAIISVGAKNSYGHPGSETLSKLESANILLYRTDLNGGISATIGKTNWFRKRCIEVWQTFS